METKFTKGEWGFNYGNLVTIGDVSYEFVNGFDAKLIAAAPEMYEMLDTIRCFLSEDGLQTNGLAKEIAKIPELLDKARGEHV